MTDCPKYVALPAARTGSTLFARARAWVTPLSTGIILLLVSCGRAKKPVAPIDNIPPSQVRDLTATALTHRSIKLRWTAPGDDGVEGRAKRYDIRYSTEPFPAGEHFPPLDTVASPPAPGLAEQPDSVVVAGLRPSTRYYFAMRVADEKGNLSPRSNVATNLTLASPDTIPPATTTDLHVVVAINTSITLGWKAPGDDGQVGTATSYDLRYSASPIDGTNWATATRVGNVPTPGAPGAGQSCQVLGLSPDRSYHFALRTSDESGNVSELSPPFQAATTRPRVWHIRADGSGDEPTIQAGINRAWWGDTVAVGPGTYLEAVEFQGRDIALISESGSEQTIVSSKGLGKPVVLLQNGETNQSLIQGLTLTGGESLFGGGISCRQAAATIRSNVICGNSARAGGGIAVGAENPSRPPLEPIIMDNVIANNRAAVIGGGIQIGEPTRATITHNQIIGNTSAFDGGGIYLASSRYGFSISANFFKGNVAHDHGGAVIVDMGAENFEGGVISDNLIVRNMSYGEDSSSHEESGAGITAFGMRGIIENNTLVFNSGALPSGAGCGGLDLWATRSPLSVRWNLIAFNDGVGVVCRENPANALFSGNLAWSNSNGNLRGVQGACPIGWAESLIVADPRFCTTMGDSFQSCANSIVFQSQVPIGVRRNPGCAACESIEK